LIHYEADHSLVSSHSRPLRSNPPPELSSCRRQTWLHTVGLGTFKPVPPQSGGAGRGAACCVSTAQQRRIQVQTCLDQKWNHSSSNRQSSKHIHCEPADRAHSHDLGSFANGLQSAVAQGLATVRAHEWASEIGRGLTTVTVKAAVPRSLRIVKIQDCENWLNAAARAQRTRCWRRGSGTSSEWTP